MSRFRLFLTFAALAAIAAAAAFFVTGQPRQLDERARYEAERLATEDNAADQKTSVAELKRRTGECPLPSLETEFFGMKRSEPDYGLQLECIDRVLYGPFFEKEYLTLRILGWASLLYWIGAAVGSAFAAVYVGFFGFRFFKEKWWPWVAGR
jgi:hypothetical protein